MKMSGLFLDPLGHHLLITLVPRHGDNPPPELFYLHRKTTKLKQAGKFKGHEITAVGWNFSNASETSSGPILLGTSKGLIFETEIGLENDKIFNTSLEQYWRQVLITYTLIRPSFHLSTCNVLLPLRYSFLTKLPNYLPLYGSKEAGGLVSLYVIFYIYMIYKYKCLYINVWFYINLCKYDKFRFHSI